MNKQTKYAILLAVFVGVLIGAGVAYFASHVGRDAMSSDVREEPVNVKTHEEKRKRKLRTFTISGSPKRNFAKDLIKLRTNMNWIYG